MAASKTKQAAASDTAETSAAQKKARAQARLAETRLQVNEARARIAEHDQQIAALDAQVRQADAAVAEQERAMVDAAAAVVAAQASSLVNDSDEELQAATQRQADVAAALAAARKASDKTRAEVRPQREDLQLARHQHTEEAQRLEKLAAALQREYDRAHAQHGQDELKAAMEERVQILERVAAARSELADALAALETHQAATANRFAPFGALAESDAVTQLDIPLFGKAEPVLEAFIVFANALQQNPGIGDAGYDGSSMSQIFSIPADQLAGLLSSGSMFSGKVLDWRIRSAQQIAASMADIQRDPSHRVHKDKLEARHGARRVARHLAAQQRGA